MNYVSMVRRAARGVATCLVLLTLGLAVPALAQPAQPGGLEVITVTPGTLTSWYVTRVRAGGPQDISSYGDSAVGPCRGFIPTSAQVRLVVTADNTDLVLRARSRRDITLLVSGPDGTFCNDDAVGTNPVMVRRFAAGNYDVYIGTYEAGQTPRASLGVMELPGLRGGNDESDDDDVVVAPAGRSLAIEAGPIWNNEQAQMTCAGVCAPYGTFRGGWWTTVAGAMSVCECRFDRGAMPCALEAGALWNQQQAASVCPGVCASEGGWDGNWWTTVPNQMSVCSCSACGR
jgi:hypothetical protein